MAKSSMIDARGLECPRPVILTRGEVENGAERIEVLVDNQVALDNVTRFLKNAGYAVQHPESDEGMKIQAFRAPEAAVGSQLPNRMSFGEDGDYSLLILSDVMGGCSGGLGEVLMKSFLATLPSMKPLPKAIALMNEGIKLALPESSCSETLKGLSSEGVKILVCGTCTRHFDVTEQVAVGDISNMFEITEMIFGAAKPVVLG